MGGSWLDGIGRMPPLPGPGNILAEGEESLDECDDRDSKPLRCGGSPEGIPFGMFGSIVCDIIVSLKIKNNTIKMS